ncbi:MAG TPA: TonB-dependent receptor [Chitinophagaceae bacterium]|nr:TonB-dependent receptor [Chitinophagaceae bacterium]
MRNISPLLLIMLTPAFLHAQLSGIVKTKKGQPVAGASIIIKGTFTATVTDSNGHFTLPNTLLKDTLVLKITSIGFEDMFVTVTKQQQPKPLSLTLSEKVARLKDVVISAGSFEASDEKKTTILKPFDLATTPAASPDIFKAVGELPGTSKVGETEGLFVRGGAASETKAVIDGMIVQDPFFSSVPGVAQNSRFSALMFKGTSFSTGGYSAQYGEALSSVLVLNTQDVAQASSSSVILNTTGISANSTQKMNNTSIALNAKYYNMQPSFSINKQNFSYITTPQGGGGNIILKSKNTKGDMFKLYASWDAARVALQIPWLPANIKNPAYSLNAHNIYLNSTYRKNIGVWQLNAGLSASHNNEAVLYDTSSIAKTNSRTQARVVLSRPFAARGKFLVGSEVNYTCYTNAINNLHYKLNDLLTAGFAEAEFYTGNKIAARAGVRAETSGTLHKTNIAPRLSIAYLLNKSSQFSFAWGSFYQLPQETYLYTNTGLRFEEATHFIINYQYTKNKRTFRIEAYYKDYNHLVKEPQSAAFQAFSYDYIPSSNTTNAGFGYAKGLDIFWYDKQRIKNLDYWLSYSYLDTKRLFSNYPSEAMPTFAAHHNVSAVIKYTIPKTSVNIGFTYNFTSGRPYYNPVHNFLSDKTPAVHNLVFAGNYSWFVKTNLFAIFIYADNILGIKNIYNYYYSADGLQRYTLLPPAYRSIYAGLNVTFAKRRTIMGINF